MARGYRNISTGVAHARMVLQPKVGRPERKQAEPYRPHPVGRPRGNSSQNVWGTAGDEAHRRLDAGKGDGHGQDHRAESPEVVPGNGQQGLAAVGGRRVEPAALRAHHGHRQVDDPHQPAAQAAGRHRVDGHRARLGDAEAPDDLHHHDAERQARQSVHGVVSLEEAAHKGRLGKRPSGRAASSGPMGLTRAVTTSTARQTRNSGLSTLPTQVRILPAAGKTTAPPKKHQRKQGQRPLASARRPAPGPRPPQRGRWRTGGWRKRARWSGRAGR